MHRGRRTGPRHGATTANTRKYIDFAAENGFRGVLVEGWNPGWDGDWFANGWGFDFTRPTADFDLEGLAAYGAAKGVHLIGHHETACAVRDTMTSHAAPRSRSTTAAGYAVGPAGPAPSMDGRSAIALATSVGSSGSIVGRR